MLWRKRSGPRELVGGWHRKLRVLQRKWLLLMLLRVLRMVLRGLMDTRELVGGRHRKPRVLRRKRLLLRMLRVLWMVLRGLMLQRMVRNHLPEGCDHALGMWSVPGSNDRTGSAKQMLMLM